MTSETKKIAVIGSGPAGLMIASRLAECGIACEVFEKRASPGRKILVAGSSGLNISYAAPRQEFHQFYRGSEETRSRLAHVFTQFCTDEWIKFIEDLGIKTFVGTSRRHFIEGMKGSTLLRAWIEKLRGQGTQFQFRKECVDFHPCNDGVEIEFSDGTRDSFEYACFALGGGSWEDTPPLWPEFFTRHQIAFEEFRAANCGFEVDWPQEFLKEAEGKPLKNISLTTQLGEKEGELVVTQYGLEGTPIYTVGTEGPAFLDLRPGISPETLRKKARDGRENLSPIRQVQKRMGLGPAAHSLLFHFCTPAERADLEALLLKIKRFPIELKKRRPLTESISSTGGVKWEEVNENHSLKKFPRVFVTGEMLDWDAPTGGFLIQACVSQGFAVADAICSSREKVLL